MCVFLSDNQEEYLMNENQDYLTQSEEIDELDKLDLTDGEWKLWSYLNKKSGPFNKALFETIFQADYLNLKRMEQVFTEEVQAYRMYKTDPKYLFDLANKIENASR